DLLLLHVKVAISGGVAFRQRQTGNGLLGGRAVRKYRPTQISSNGTVLAAYVHVARGLTVGEAELYGNRPLLHIQLTHEQRSFLQRCCLNDGSVGSVERVGSSPGAAVLLDGSRNVEWNLLAADLDHGFVFVLAGLQVHGEPRRTH